MGIIRRSVIVCGLFCGIVTAAPKLRLSTTAVGPVFVTVGQNGAAQVVGASNAGDGSLTLTASANVPWIGASISGGTSIQIALNTSALARGKYTGVVTVNDPNAVDAPQNIIVTVQAGSAVPDSVDLYLPPGGSATASFTPANPLAFNVTNPTSGATLSVAGFGAGSFGFSLSYQIKAQSPAGTADGDYSGAVVFSGSTQAADNKRVPVVAHVTSQPIASWAPLSVQFRIAQGAAKQTQVLVFSNTGLGALTLSGVTGNPAWLSATIQGNFVVLTADPTGMAPGAYPVTIAVASNARNGAASIPVELDVLATGPPVTYYQGVLDNALFKVGDALAPGGIVALFGEQLTAGAVTQAAALPLTSTLGGASVFVNNQPAPVYYVSAGQIDFLIPYATPSGDAVVRVDRDGQRGNSVSVKIAATAPRLLRLGLADYANAVLSDPVLTFPIPPTPGISSRPAKAGVDVVVFYALGLGQTNPPAADGQAAVQAQTAPVNVVFGESLLPGTGFSADPAYAGLTPGFVGLYQINVLVPASSPRGDAVSVYLDMSGVFSNRVNIAIQ